MIDYLLLLFRVLVFPGFTFIILFTMFCDWIERKIEARMQNRMGPTFTGPGGILQPIADFIKEHNYLRAPLKWVLAPVVYFVQYPSHLALMAGLCLIIIIGARRQSLRFRNDLQK